MKERWLVQDALQDYEKGGCGTSCKKFPSPFSNKHLIAKDLLSFRQFIRRIILVKSINCIPSVSCLSLSAPTHRQQRSFRGHTVPARGRTNRGSGTYKLDHYRCQIGPLPMGGLYWFTARGGDLYWFTARGGGLYWCTARGGGLYWCTTRRGDQYWF